MRHPCVLSAAESPVSETICHYQVAAFLLPEYSLGTQLCTFHYEGLGLPELK